MNNENNPHDEKIFRNRKPRTCPSCNGKNVAVILWGDPLETAELDKALHENKIILGGCCISDNDPTWQCTDCHVEIWRQLRPSWSDWNNIAKETKYYK